MEKKTLIIEEKITYYRNWPPWRQSCTPLRSCVTCPSGGKSSYIMLLCLQERKQKNLRLKTNCQPDKGQVCLERTVVSGQTDIRSKLDQTWKVKGWKVALTLEESLDFPKQFQKAQFLILPISYPEAFMSRCAVVQSTQSSDVWKPV